MLFFITVNYYSTNLIVELVDSLSKNVNCDYKLIIVNNSPEDDSIHQLKSDRIMTINAEQNLGFGSGCNIAIQYIYSLDKKAKIWLINPDATLDKDAADYVLKCFTNHPSVAILGTKIRDDQDKIWFSSGKFNPETGYLKHETIANQQEATNSEVLITGSRWVCGCSLIINLANFDHCPLFDPQYFLYNEDVDLCERYYQKKYQIAITNSILVNHKVSAIIGKNKTSMFDNYTYSRLYLLSKHANILALITYLIYLPIIILLTIFTNYDIAVGRWQGLKKFIQPINNRK